MSRWEEFLKVFKLKPSTRRHIGKALPFAGVIFGSVVVLKNYQEYKLLLHKVKTKGTVSESEAEKLAEKHGMNRKELIKQHMITREKEKEALESSLLQKEWHNIRIPRGEEGDPRSVQALRKVTLLEQDKHAERLKTAEAVRASKRLDPLLAEAKVYLETSHKYMDAFNDKHKKNALVLEEEKQAVQAMHFSEFFRKQLQNGKKLLPKLEVCLELGGLTDAQIKELKVILGDLAKTNAELRKCMKYCWDEQDIYLSSLRQK